MALFFFVIVAAVIAIVLIARMKEPRTAGNVLEIIVVTSFVVFIGFSCIMAGLAHLFGGEKIARQIGWQPSPFEWEVGVANLAIGALGVLCIWFRREMLLATIVAGTIWMWGNMVGHIKQMVKYHDYAPGNAGIFIWVACAMFLVLVILYIAYRVAEKKEAEAPAGA